MEKIHGPRYERLDDEQKEVADTIIGYLNGQNTGSIERILHVLIDEIKYQSVIST